jgi:hypothetical protein
MTQPSSKKRKGARRRSHAERTVQATIVTIGHVINSLAQATPGNFAHTNGACIGMLRAERDLLAQLILRGHL